MKFSRRDSLRLTAATTVVTVPFSSPLFAQEKPLKTGIPLDMFDPFGGSEADWQKLRPFFYTHKGAKAMLNELWGAYERGGPYKYGEWAMLYCYNYWRMVPTGKPRVKIAQIGRKMSESLRAKHPESAWNTFWNGAFIGLEAISIGILNAAQLLPQFEKIMQEVIAIDPTVYYGSAYVGLAKLYIKTPPFPVGIGDMEKGYKNLELCRPYQEKKFPIWYLFYAEAELLTKGIDAAQKIYDRMKAELKPQDTVSRYTFETTIVDMETLLAAAKDGSYNKYSWDPMFTPFDTSKLK